MKKVIILSMLIFLPLHASGQSINLLCKFDSKKEEEKRFQKSFSISIIKNNGSYSIFKNDKNVEKIDQHNSAKISNVSITQNEISFEVNSVIPPNNPLGANPGYDNRVTKISRLDGRIMEIVYWRGGYYESLNFENPFILTGTCEKRTQSKF